MIQLHVACSRAIHITAQTKSYLTNTEFVCEPVEQELDDELLRKFKIESFLVRPPTIKEPKDHSTLKVGGL